MDLSLWFYVYALLIFDYLYEGLLLNMLVLCSLYNVYYEGVLVF